jgi:type IV pilus assembly protein PilY1
MKKFLAFLMLALAAGTALADVTGIATLPLLNLNGTGNVKPNLMLLYDNSGSMAYQFTPDYVDDSSTCRSRSTMAGGTMACKIGHPPYTSSDFNRQYYDPKVRYTPAVTWDGTSYTSMTRKETSDWTKVPTDAFGVNKTDLLGASSTQTDLVKGFPDLRWCDTDDRNCVYNTATYAYPSDSRYTSDSIKGNPYYYTINVAEYCSDEALTKCVQTAVGAAAPAGYTYPAKVRWCDSKALTNCQAKYVGNFKYPRFGSPNGGFIGAFGTITINASTSATSMDITSVTVTEPNRTVTITNGTVNAPNGTNTAARQSTLAAALATSIINKTGLSNQYLACVRTPGNTGVPSCSSYGISLAADNIVAVIPLDCPAGTNGKSLTTCSLVDDDSRAGWPLTVNASAVQTQAAQPATALIAVTGTAANTNTASNMTLLKSGTTLGGTTIIKSNITFAKNASSTTIAGAIRDAINASGVVTAYLAKNAISTVCNSAATNTICVVDTKATLGGAAIVIPDLTNPNSVKFTVTASKPPVVAVFDTIPTATTPLGGGGSVFVRTDIVSTVNSYPKSLERTDCAGATCSYDEEMTNFANWYAYYKTRNQMMKTSVGLAFQALNANYNVGIVSLSTAAAEGGMTAPRQFAGSNRTSWYTSLYAMNGSNATPIRQALHAIGKMYANQAPYVASAGNEVVQYPCQQNFTFVTTDGYWNGGAAATVTNNDNKESTSRFCTRATGCFDPSDQSANSLADVALYWYNGGSNDGTSSLRPTLEDWTKEGLVRGRAGDNKRLHMNTYTLGLGVDGIMNYQDDYDTAPKGDFYNLITGVTSGCPWNGGGAYVWPDPVTSDSNGGAAYQSRVDDLWHAAINGHGKYFSASAPKQVVAGLAQALSAIEQRTGAASAAATSTPNITMEDNDVFSSTFTTVRWYGELADRKISPSDGTVSKDVVWTTTKTLGQKVAASSDSRNILMLGTDNALKPFLYGSLTATEQAWFNNKCNELAQCPSLTDENRKIVNNGATIVNWLRGQQQYADDTILRAYTRVAPDTTKPDDNYLTVLGDIASSKPAYLRESRKAYTLDGYAEFKSANAARTGTVFVGANDGMLHAFDAANGNELWAFAPRSTMKKLYLQASTTYGTNHQYSVDGAPELGEVQIDGKWRSVLVGGLNAGGRGYFALDVTDPTAPKGLWELCADATVCSGANLDADIGLTFGNPQFGTWRDSGGTSHWAVFLTSGYNNVPGIEKVGSGDGKGYLYVVDIATGRVLSKSSTNVGSTTTPSGFARITAITANPQTDPLVTYVYGGDNQGKMWRFDFTAGGDPTVLQMGDAGTAQPVTARPEVTTCRVENRDAQGNITVGISRVVAFGTGRLLDVPDISDVTTQSVYVLKDSGTPISAASWRNSSSMTRRQLTTVKVNDVPTGDYTMDDQAVDLSTRAGWYFDLDQNKGERVNLDPKVVAGTLDVVTNLPSNSDACTVGGSSNLYLLDACTALPLQAGGVAGSTLSSSSAAVGSLVVQLPGGTFVQISTLANGDLKSTKFPPAQSSGARKSGWRRVRE